MSLSTTIATDTEKIFTTAWSIRDGQVVPKTDDVTLSNGAVKLDAVVLYADLANSTRLARQFPNTMAAKIVRAYLSSMAKLIKANAGHVRSFDGDRVMGVFHGGSKNTNAAKCALQMSYVVTDILRPKAEAQFSSLKSKGFVLTHCAGVASSEVLVVRGGVRGSNDLVFIGSAPNIAAKLSDIRVSGYRSFITHQVHDMLHAKSKLGPKGESMWTRESRDLGDETWTVYRSNWYWEP